MVNFLVGAFDFSPSTGNEGISALTSIGIHHLKKQVFELSVFIICVYSHFVDLFVMSRQGGSSQETPSRKKLFSQIKKKARRPGRTGPLTVMTQRSSCHCYVSVGLQVQLNAPSRTWAAALFRVCSQSTLQCVASDNRPGVITGPEL